MKSQTVVDILEKYKKQVWPEIDRYLSDPIYPSSFKIPSHYLKDAEYHWRLAREYPERKGKYLRAALILLSGEAMGGNPSYALKTAAAMQISEDWLLIHDDLEDHSLERRGKPTLHRICGTELAINAGDALHVIMWKILFDNEALLGAKKTELLLNEFYKMLTRTTLGQNVELKWSKENKTDFTDSDWFFICDGKTSYYSVAGPMRLGAIIAGAKKEQLESLAEFGKYLGRSYQLVDDILDITSDFAGLKKQTGNDIREGKRTVMLGHLLRNANLKDKRSLVLILNKTGDTKTKQEVAWVIQKMKNYGSIEYARQLAKKFKNQAQGILKKKLEFLSRQPARSDLETLIQFIIERNY